MNFMIWALVFSVEMIPEWQDGTEICARRKYFFLWFHHQYLVLWSSILKFFKSYHISVIINHGKYVIFYSTLFFYVLRLFFWVDINKEGIDKLYYYSRITNIYIQMSCNDIVNNDIFQYQYLPQSYGKIWISMILK